MRNPWHPVRLPNMIAEKRIMDVLFEIKVNESAGGLHQIVQTNQLPTIQINQLPNQPALDMNQQFQLKPMRIYLIQTEIVPLFAWTKCFFPIKHKNCKHSLYFKH